MGQARDSNPSGALGDLQVHRRRREAGGCYPGFSADTRHHGWRATGRGSTVTFVALRGAG